MASSSDQDPEATLDQTETVELTEEQRRTAKEAEDYVKRSQYGQTGDMLDTGMGHMGGAGASGSGPDIGTQSAPMSGNHSDLPSGSR